MMMTKATDARRRKESPTHRPTLVQFAVPASSAIFPSGQSVHEAAAGGFTRRIGCEMTIPGATVNDAVAALAQDRAIERHAAELGANVGGGDAWDTPTAARPRRCALGDPLTLFRAQFSPPLGGAPALRCARAEL